MKTTSSFTLLFCALALLAFSLQTQPASAGFTEVHVWPEYWDSAEEPAPVVEILPDGNATAHVWEHFDAEYGLNYGLNVWGDTDELDPELTITKEVTNDSGFPWFGYNLSMPVGPNVFELGSATSVGMSLESESPYLLEFGLPAPVPNGGTVSFTFTVIIPPGPFEFSLTQTPEVPEPTSIAMVSIASVLLLAARRRRSL